jgi:hypothetical protein
MATQSAIHHMLAILAGDVAPGREGEAAVDDLACLIARLGWGRLAPDALAPNSDDAVSPWFVRVTFPGIAPTDAFIITVASAAGLRVESLAEAPAAAHGPSQSRATWGRPERWLLVAPQSRDAVSSAVAHLRAVHRIHAVPFRTVED